MKNYKILFFILMLSNFGYGQSIGSFQKLVNEREILPGEKVLQLIEQSKIYHSNNQRKESIASLQKAVKEANNTNDDKLLKKTLLLLSTAYYKIDSIRLGKDIFAKAEAISRNDNEIKAYQYDAEGNFFKALGQKSKALISFKEAIEYAEKSSDNYVLFEANSMQFNLLFPAGDYKKMKERSENALLAARKLGNVNYEVAALGMLASSYRMEAMIKKDMQILLKTKPYLDEIEKKMRESNQVADYMKMMFSIEIANYYFYTDTAQQNRSIILMNLDKAEEIAKKQNNNNAFTRTFLMRSDLSMQDQDKREAESWLIKAYDLVKLGGRCSDCDAQIRVEIAQSLRDFYEKEGNIQKHLFYEKELSRAKDTLHNKKQSEALKIQNIISESKEKDQLISDLKLKQKNKYLLYILTITSLLSLVAVWRFKNLKEKHLINTQMLLVKEKEAAEMRIIAEKEENARIVAEKKIHEMEKESLQKILLAEKLQIQHKNSILKKIDDKIEEKNPAKRVLRKELNTTKTFERTKDHIKNIHPSFYNKLYELSRAKLTDLDIKICSLIFLRMDNKEIASLLNIEPKSVRMAKYRIKNKFQMDENQKLDDFIHSLNI